MAFTLSAVPTGTVDLSTTINLFCIDCPIDLATDNTYCKSADPSSPIGVPTAIKVISEFKIIKEKSLQLENLATRLAKYLSPQIYQSIFEDNVKNDLEIISVTSVEEVLAVALSEKLQSIEWDFTEYENSDNLQGTKQGEVGLPN